MFAVIRTGGKQYRVAQGDVIAVEKLPGEAGGEVAFDEVLLVADESGTTAGKPTVAGARVTATVLEQGRGDKIVVFKKKRRKDYRRTRGHRQAVTVLRIADITVAKGKPAAKNKAAAAAKPKAHAEPAAAGNTDETANTEE